MTEIRLEGLYVILLLPFTHKCFDQNTVKSECQFRLLGHSIVEEKRLRQNYERNCKKLKLMSQIRRSIKTTADYTQKHMTDG